MKYQYMITKRNICYAFIKSNENVRYHISAYNSGTTMWLENNF